MEGKTEVTVLSTMHFWHGSVAFFSFDDLTQIIRKIAPDLLGVELTQEDLEERREQRIKQEYQRSVYPLLDEHFCEAFPLEPPEPKFSQLVQMGRKAQEELSERSPEVAQALEKYAEILYETLFAWWSSPLDVNSEETDRHFEIKHKYEEAIYGPKEREGWEGWNQHFLDQILEAARRNPGARILVLAGVEHGYWLRKRLREEREIRWVSVQRYLK